MGRIVETFWSCPYCGTGDIRGRYRECPNCGRARGNVTFQVKDPEQNYVSEEEARNISREPDWLCPYCDTLNSAKLDRCESCGASRAESTKNYFDIQQEEAKKNEESPSESLDEPNPVPEPAEQDKKVNHDMREKLKTAGILTLYAVGLCFFTVLLIALLKPKPDTLIVQDIQWQCSISVEELKTYEESGWEKPPGARVVDTQTELYTYEKVLDHYETVTDVGTREVIDHYEERVIGYRDLGNGYAEEITSSAPVYRTETYTETHEKPIYREEPVYRTKYYYEIDRWTTCRTVDTRGNDHTPVYGELNLRPGERKGSASCRYTITAQNTAGEIKSYTMNEEDWLLTNSGDTLRVKVTLGEFIEVQERIPAVSATTK